MTARKRKADAADPHDVATNWLLRYECGALTAAEEASFNAWLDEDPSHASAWRSVRRALTMIAANAGHDEMMALRTAALAVKPERHWARTWAIAASVLLVIGAGGLWSVAGYQFELPAASVQRGGGTEATPYRTAVGERSTFSLPDGSSMTLDTNSEVKVSYDAAERGVHLIRGQALFDVAKHKSRPFRVYAAGQVVTAVGTRFNVRVDGDGNAAKVHVALIEGVVTVSPKPRFGLPKPSPRDLTLSAGELLEASPEAAVSIVAADMERLVSWRSGVLAFEDTPLDQAVREMNRYTKRPVSLSDPALAEYRLNGVFRTGDARRFAETVTELFPIDVREDADGGQVLVARHDRSTQ